MATKEQIEILKSLSVDDIKKYRPDLNVEAVEDADKASLTESNNEDNSSLKKRAGCGSFFLISFIVIALLFIFTFINPHAVTTGRLYHYLFLWGMMSLLWFELPDGQLSPIGQFVVFVGIPFIEFILVQLLGISNGFGLLFIIIYGVILCLIYKIDLNDGNSSYSDSGTAGKLLGSAMKGAIKGMGGSSRKR